ncbi:cell wall-associated NlpC family hydrolase [Flavobacterium endophyticum]|uniref:Cell wall-associated NlpC family hydrolase n=1 Tax=Flavobacterium endophyticum TaxID=1540163 RepID=A0A495MN19_9FLAO|nr:C40 family peptidase [Flavobacterium endophyticum]RKS26780.1 cell wall-associated NlpC family hydrolase [Flavobacterium endophyticum]
MSAKKILFLFLPLLLLVSTLGHSQIITTKKEALKKGVYEKPAEKKNTIVAEKPAPVVAEKAKVSKNTKPLKNKKSVIVEQEDPDLVVSTPTESYISLQLINNAMNFLGVRYRGGGTTTAGMDCSGMVTAVFNLFDIKLPRSSHDMAMVGEKVDTNDIKKGDLIFFRTNGRRVINHVGVVIEKIGDEIKFIHSSTSKGVVVSSTNEPYYKRTFAQVNRIIQQ